jgi:hypothetical protein
MGLNSRPAWHKDQCSPVGPLLTKTGSRGRRRILFRGLRGWRKPYSRPQAVQAHWMCVPQLLYQSRRNLTLDLVRSCLPASGQKVS